MPLVSANDILPIQIPIIPPLDLSTPELSVLSLSVIGSLISLTKNNTGNCMGLTASIDVSNHSDTGSILTMDVQGSSNGGSTWFSLGKCSRPGGTHLDAQGNKVNNMTMDSTYYSSMGTNLTTRIVITLSRGILLTTAKASCKWQ